MLCYCVHRVSHGLVGAISPEGRKAIVPDVPLEHQLPPYGRTVPSEQLATIGHSPLPSFSPKGKWRTKRSTLKRIALIIANTTGSSGVTVKWDRVLYGPKIDVI